MDIDEKLKEEQLEYYKRENELREAMIKRQRLYWKLVKISAIVIFLLFATMTACSIITQQMIITKYSG